MKKIERLSAMAAGRADPMPLDAAGVMARIRAESVADDSVLAMPFRYYAGGVAAAAAAAAVVGFLGVTAWSDLSSPFQMVESLLDVTEYLI